MYWILAAVFLAVALAVPRLRVVGIVGCVVLGVMLGWGMVQRLRGTEPEQAERGRPTSPATVRLPIPVGQVKVDGLKLTGAGAPFELRGQVTNNTRESVIRSIDLRVTRRDCYEGALDPTGCALLWQDSHWIAITVPPGQSREFATSIWMHGAAGRPRGTTQDSFELLAASGDAAPTLERESQAETQRAEPLDEEAGPDAPR